MSKCKDLIFKLLQDQCCCFIPNVEIGIKCIFCDLKDELKSCEKEEQNLLVNEIREHYRVNGYEKQHYLRKILEEKLNTKFKIFDEEVDD